LGTKLTRFIKKRLVQDSCAPVFWAFYGTIHCNIRQVRKGEDDHSVDHQIPDTDPIPKEENPLTFGIDPLSIQLFP
jgi:hypothetical protein